MLIKVKKKVTYSFVFIFKCTEPGFLCVVTPLVQTLPPNTGRWTLKTRFLLRNKQKNSVMFNSY